MLKKEDILQIISDELANAIGSTSSNSKSFYEEALGLYLGDKDGKEVEGRSHVVSTDIADAIEWIMPQIMKSFTQNNEIVVFDPVHEGDERQAEMESEYVYEVLMKQNDGFIILHQFVKDALMQRNGILKTYYAERTKTRISEWTGITEDQYNQLVAAEGVEILSESSYIDQEQTLRKQQQLQLQIKQIEQTAQTNPQAPQLIERLYAEAQKPVTLYDVQVGVERTKGQIYVDPVPPEEFRVNSRHNSINLDEARFSAHVTTKKAYEVIEEFDLDLKATDELPGSSSSYETEYRFRMGPDSVFYEDSESDIDASDKDIEVSECFKMIDIDQTGVPQLFKVTVAGDSDNVTDILSVEPIDELPWISTTAILMSHKFQGLSITDRLKQIQDQKTTLWRNMFDNMYLQNNQRHAVLENQVNLDDLMISRPGGIVRVKSMDAIMPLATPQLGSDSYNMMEYLDRVRAGRTGVDPDGTATPQNIGDRVGSEGVDRLMNAKEELVGLIIRVIAETGVKPLCVKIRDLSIKHVNSVVDFRFRGVWQQINPATWCDRTSTTVRVGTGTGDHLQQINALREILAIQEKLVANPKQSLLDEVRAFNAIDDFCKFSGLNGATRYFLDPTSPEGQAKKKQVEKASMTMSQKEEAMQNEMTQIQKQLANAETEKVKIQQQNIAIKGQVDSMKNQLQFQKQNSDSRIAELTQQLNEMKEYRDAVDKEKDRDLKKYELDQRTAVELTRIEAQNKTQQDANFKQNQDNV